MGAWTGIVVMDIRNRVFGPIWEPSGRKSNNLHVYINREVEKLKCNCCMGKHFLLVLLQEFDQAHYVLATVVTHVLVPGVTHLFTSSWSCFLVQ